VIENKRVKISLIISVIGILVILTGSTYAIFSKTITSEKKQIIRTGGIKLEIIEAKQGIDLSNFTVQDDASGLAQTETYDFSIKNTGDTNAKYKINLVDTSSQIDTKYIKVGLEVNNKETGPMNLYEVNKIINEGIINKGKTIKFKLRLWVDESQTDNLENLIEKQITLKIKATAEQYFGGATKTLDESGANPPLLAENMMPVYYDETAKVWKKADQENIDEEYKWYDYNNKMWANAVTTTVTNRTTYLNAEPGTTIPMTDINTMWVWIPRYKYTYFASAAPTEIPITFESNTDKTGTITCTEAISANSGKSETCTDTTNGSLTVGKSTYTHPAFTFGNQELPGLWVGKFENSATSIPTSSSTTLRSVVIKPDVQSWRYTAISYMFKSIRNMEAKSNAYGFPQTGGTQDTYTGEIANDSNKLDTHMIKNMEWGAMAYLSHSKYGRCNKGECQEISINNSSSYYTGRSGGTTSSTANGTYTYNQTETKEMLTGGTEVTPTVTNDTTYPWTETNGVYKSTTQGKNSTTTNLKFKFTATGNTALSFDWSVSSESATYDYIYYTITKNGTTVSGTGETTKIGGTTYGTTEAALTYLTVEKELDAGEYEITFTYRKDSSAQNGTDTGYVKNLKVITGQERKPVVVWIGGAASTTGNVYGIYDTSGGSSEYVMANMQSSSDNSFYPNSAATWSSTNKPLEKYYNRYSYGASSTDVARGKLGDATKEIKATTSWYLDTGLFLTTSGYWFHRGESYISTSSAGIFGFNYTQGEYSSILSTRSVLTITED